MARTQDEGIVGLRRGRGRSQGRRGPARFCAGLVTRDTKSLPGFAAERAAGEAPEEQSHPGRRRITEATSRASSLPTSSILKSSILKNRMSCRALMTLSISSTWVAEAFRSDHRAHRRRDKRLFASWTTCCDGHRTRPTPSAIFRGSSDWYPTVLLDVSVRPVIQPDSRAECSFIRVENGGYLEGTATSAIFSKP